MKKLISFILTVILSLSVFSCVSCFADPEKSIYLDKDSFLQIERLASHLDHACATKFFG